MFPSFERFRRSPSLPEEYTPHFSEPVEDTLDKISKITRGTPDSYGATPLDQLATMAQQQELLTQLIAYTYQVPDGVSLQIADYVHSTFSERFTNRGNANNDNYVRSLLSKEAYADSPQVLDVIQRAETGHASAAELIVVRKLLGIRSVELACLTHPYGERINPEDSLLDEMRDVVGMSVLELGGTLYDNPEPHYRVKEVILGDVPYEDWPQVYGQSNIQRLHEGDAYGGVTGLLMTRKRTIGVMPDGTIIKERSSFVLRTDCNNPTAYEALQLMKTVEDDSNWQESAVKAGHLDEVVSTLLKDNKFSLAIPVASTIYAHNPETARQVNDRYGEHGVRSRAIDFPSSVMAELDNDQFVAQYGDMFFVGHEDPLKEK